MAGEKARPLAAQQAETEAIAAELEAASAFTPMRPVQGVGAEDLIAWARRVRALSPTPASKESPLLAQLQQADERYSKLQGDALRQLQKTEAQLQQARQEREEARGAEQLAMGHLRSLQEDHVALRARVEALESDIEDHEHLRERLTFLLTGTVNAIRGLPELMHVHGWQSLPEEAASLKAALAAEQQARLTEVEHWVGRYNELEAWRVSLSVRLQNAEAALQQAQQEREAAREALKKYGEHDPTCDAMACAPCLCTCGLDAALTPERR